MPVNTPIEFLALERSHIREAGRQASASLPKIAGEAQSNELRQIPDHRLPSADPDKKQVQQMQNG